MEEKVTIPVKVLRPTGSQAVLPANTASGRYVEQSHHESNGNRPVEEEQVLATAEPVTEGQPSITNTGEEFEQGHDPVAHLQAELDRWRDQALRLQAEMDNFRKRQQRLAQDQIEAERQRLLGVFLRVVDDLERALAAPAGDGNGLRQGIQLTYRTALQLLQKEGVEQIQAQDQPFDPHWHEAVATVNSDGRDMAPNTVVRVMEPGYRLGDRLLRPVRVVVAV